ncbi:MAG: phosphatase PAP2 family protein [Smithella sp.]|nr:phosphatase PAP2 family protein [Smithella sp.]
MKKRWTALALIISGAALAGVAYVCIDIPLVHFCRGLGRPVLDATEWITMAGESHWYFMILASALLIFRLIAKNRKWTIRMFFLLACISASGLINLLLKWIAGRNRPVNLFDHGLFGFDFFEAGYALNSFPSGHTVTVFSLAAALTILFPRFGAWTFLPAAVIAASRVMLTSHYLSDVIAGAVVGMVSTLGVKYVFDRANADFGPSKENRNARRAPRDPRAIRRAGAGDSAALER